jgi:hypothetical protein
VEKAYLRGDIFEKKAPLRGGLGSALHDTREGTASRHGTGLSVAVKLRP